MSIPVSYTHLDVYKRQDQRMVPDAYSFLRAGDWNSKGEMGWWGISSNDKKPDAWRPVSYTHLDVYKRQQGFPR